MSVPNAGTERCHPKDRAAFFVVTSHWQPDPRVVRPGRESNPVHLLSQKRADIQSQGATTERSSTVGGCPLVKWVLVRRGQHRAKGPPGPFCASESDVPPIRRNGAERLRFGDTVTPWIFQRFWWLTQPNGEAG